MRQPHVAQPDVVYKPNEIPSESSFEFSLGLCPKSSSPVRTLSTSAHKSFGYYALLYGFSVFGLRVISNTLFFLFMHYFLGLGFQIGLDGNTFSFKKAKCAPPEMYLACGYVAYVFHISYLLNLH